MEYIRKIKETGFVNDTKEVLNYIQWIKEHKVDEKLEYSYTYRMYGVEKCLECDEEYYIERVGDDLWDLFHDYEDYVWEKILEIDPYFKAITGHEFNCNICGYEIDKNYTCENFWARLEDATINCGIDDVIEDINNTLNIIELLEQSDQIESFIEWCDSKEV